MKPQGQIHTLAWLANAQEKRAFEFYIRRAAPLLSGVLDSDFWNSLLPKLAETDVAIRYIMLAISHFCEHPLRQEEGGRIYIHTLSRRHLIALQWQARALSTDKCLQSRVNPTNLILKYTLLSCHEFQQNNLRNGRKLVRTAFSFVAPLLTSGCDHSSSPTVVYDEILEIIIPILMRNACLLFNSSTQPTDHVADTTNLHEIESMVFHYLCIVFASVKDVYLTSTPHAHLIENKMVVRLGDLLCALQTLQAKIIACSAEHPQTQVLRRQALHEYCGIGIRWLGILCQLVSGPFGEQHFLQTILNGTRELKLTAQKTFPAAARTTYFDSFVISSPAYFLTIFTKSSRMRSEALALLKKSAPSDTDAMLLAIVETTAQIKNDPESRIGDDSVYEIYYGSKDRDLLLHDVCDEPTST